MFLVLVQNKILMDRPDLCDCNCHDEANDVEHEMSCCYTCSQCGEYVKLSLIHLNSHCKARKHDQGIVVASFDQDSDVEDSGA